MAKITVIKNAEDAPLSKTLKLGESGKLEKIAAAAMTSGAAKAIDVANAAELADLLGKLTSSHALTLGTPMDETREKLGIKLRPSKQDVDGGTIARTLKHFHFKPDEQGFALVDMDLGGCPRELAARIEDEGLAAVLADYLPGLDKADYLIRPSTSAKLRHAETGQDIIGSRGVHLYIRVQNAADIPRMVAAIFARLVVDGHGWVMLSTNGRRLVRSVVDATVASPERLVFEGPPLLIAPVSQDAADRACTINHGDAYDSETLVTTLTPQEQQQYDAVVSRMKEEMRDAAAAKRNEYIEARAPKIAKESGLSIDVVRARLRAQFSRGDNGGNLTNPHQIHMDDGRVVTVMEILLAPSKFHDLTCADPDDGPAYGSCKARIYHQPSKGRTIIHSLAHGAKTTYELRPTVEVVEELVRRGVEAVEKDERAKSRIVESLLDMVIAGGDAINSLEEEDLIARIEPTFKVKRRALNALLKRRKTHFRQIEEAEHAARRRSNLPEVRRPEQDAPLGPTVTKIDRILAADTSDKPPMRDDTGTLCKVAVREPIGLHLFAAVGGDGELQPPPAEPLITQLTSTQSHLLLEDHCDIFKEAKVDNVTVRMDARLPEPFIMAIRTNDESQLPLVRGVCTLPFLSGGRLLSGSGFDRTSGLHFHVDHTVSRSIPTEKPTKEQAQAAVKFLLNEWLCDALTDTTGRITMIAMALTVIQRFAMVEQPAFVVNANMRGSGKTTLINMVAQAVLGRLASAARWSDSEEERRKALLPPLLQGVPLIVWDNLARGAGIDCDAINSAVTSATYEDRILGHSEIARAASNSVFCLNGNNVGPTGDFARRCLMVNLSTDRPDPENRTFKHVDPIGWTAANRARIVRSLYTVLLWNPLRDADAVVDEARVLGGFRTWWTQIGYPLEELAAAHDETALSWRDIVRASETVSPEVEGLQKLLSALADTISKEAEFTASDLAAVLNAARLDDDFAKLTSAQTAAKGRAGDIEDGIALAMPKGSALPPFGKISPVILGRKLAALKDRPVDVDGKVLKLTVRNPRNTQIYSVEAS
ncbi:hypothetical protein [Celeribacter marinus]|uniref:hypothetical protein n=1 Tax=Celeribacter marinus TaxID=1397108 RepID=UPI00316EC80C